MWRDCGLKLTRLAPGRSPTLQEQKEEPMTLHVEGLPRQQAADTKAVPCAGGCGRQLPKPDAVGNRIVLCRSCWSKWLHAMMNLVRVVKEEL